MATKSAHRHKQTLELAYALESSSLPLYNGKPGIPRLHISLQRLTQPSFTYILSHNFLSILLLTHTHEGSEGERIEDPKGRAACMLWVSNRIMKGLQRLVGAPFIATVKTNLKFFTLIE